MRNKHKLSPELDLSHNMNVLQKNLSIKFHILKEKSSQKETATEFKSDWEQYEFYNCQS